MTAREALEERLNYLATKCELPNLAAEIRTFVASQSERATLPEGWVAVPRVPTTSMLNAARDTDQSYWKARETRGADAADIYHAMLAAAPSPTDNEEKPR